MACWFGVIVLVVAGFLRGRFGRFPWSGIWRRRCTRSNFSSLRIFRWWWRRTSCTRSLAAFFTTHFGVFPLLILLGMIFSRLLISTRRRAAYSTSLTLLFQFLHQLLLSLFKLLETIVRICCRTWFSYRKNFVNRAALITMHVLFQQIANLVRLVLYVLDCWWRRSANWWLVGWWVLNWPRCRIWTFLQTQLGGGWLRIISTCLCKKLKLVRIIVLNRSKILTFKVIPASISTPWLIGCSASDEVDDWYPGGNPSRRLLSFRIFKKNSRSGSDLRDRLRCARVGDLVFCELLFFPCDGLSILPSVVFVAATWSTFGMGTVELPSAAYNN